MSAPATVPVRRWSVEATASAAVGASLLIALAALLVPLRADVRELRGDVHALAERVARIEGALTGPYRLPPPAPEAGE